VHALVVVIFGNKPAGPLIRQFLAEEPPDVAAGRVLIQAGEIVTGPVVTAVDVWLLLGEQLVEGLAVGQLVRPPAGSDRCRPVLRSTTPRSSGSSPGGPARVSEVSRTS
jgi:hypothetical protein